MEANIDNEDEQLAAAAAAAASASAKKQRRLKLTSVLERFDKYPNRTRNKTDELVERFLQDLGDDIHDMLCDNTDVDDEDYRGLDSERDTEEEVETAIRFFPEVLSRTKYLFLGEEEEEEEEERAEELMYPIYYLTFLRHEGWNGCNVKAVSFIPLVARLAIEFGLFEEEDRGGLLCQGVFHGNALQRLVGSSPTGSHNYELDDDKYTRVLIQLRKIGLLKKEDIQRYELLKETCRSVSYFAEKRLRFLFEWHPSALTQADSIGRLPLHYACNTTVSNSPTAGIERFRVVFEYGICYYPKKKGINLLFRKSFHDDNTPFEGACEKFGYEQVMKVVEDTLIRYSSSSASTNKPQPLNVAEALLFAAIDEDVHLDCVYFLLRRHPFVLQELLSPLPYKSRSRKRKREIS
jgi:hypothetical protein